MHTLSDLQRFDDRRIEDHVVCFSGVSWDDYLRLMAMRGDHSAPRISYLKGEVEIMSPSETHERENGVKRKREKTGSPFS